jgi:hypothetical protein
MRSCAGNPHDPGIDDHLSLVRASGERANVDRCLPVLLRLQELRRATQAQAGRLLRFLLLWLGAVPADAREPPLRLNRPSHFKRTVESSFGLGGSRGGKESKEILSVQEQLGLE